MTLKPFYLLFFVALAGCGLRQRERVLEQKAAALAEKEQELVLREKTLDLRQQELDNRAQSIDSTSSDSATGINPQLAGRWAAKMTCTEASCPGSAVGDVKNENWQFSYLNQNLVVRAVSGNSLVRVYTGHVINNIIELRDEVDSSTGNGSTQIYVRLTPTQNGGLEGTREIERLNECKIVYSLQLTKQ